MLSYANSQAGKTQALQQKLRDLKQQISERGLLDPPKFGSWQNVFDGAYLIDVMKLFCYRQNFVIHNLTIATMAEHVELKMTS